MRSVSSALQTKLAADNVVLIPLFAIDAATPIRRALWGEDVTFDGATYTADGGSFSQLQSGLYGLRPTYELALQNAKDADDDSDLPWTNYDVEGLNGVEVLLRVVEESLLADADAVILEERWHVSGAMVDHEYLHLRLGSPHDALALEVPRLPIGAKTCDWKYKVGACTSQSALPTCPKTLAACIARFPAGAVLPFGPVYPFMSRVRRGRGN